MMIFSGERSVKPLNLMSDDNDGLDAKLTAALVEDLKAMTELVGKMEWAPEAVKAIEAWHNGGGEPIPEHPRLIHYVSRRSVQLLKLCAIAAISVNHRRIELVDYQAALDWLIEAEFFMPDIFKAMVTGGDASAIDEAWFYVWTMYAKEKRPLSEHRLIHFIQQKVPLHNVTRVVEMMVRSNMIRVAGSSAGRTLYEPVAKQLHAAS